MQMMFIAVVPAPGEGPGLSVKTGLSSQFFTTSAGHASNAYYASRQVRRQKHVQIRTNASNIGKRLPQSAIRGLIATSTTIRTHSALAYLRE